MEVAVVLRLPGAASAPTRTHNKFLRLCVVSIHKPTPTATAATSYSYCTRRRRILVVTNSISKDSESAGEQTDMQIEEIRVCTNRTCRRQGSMQTLETITALAPPNVAVTSSGCLGRCGAGPNLVALPTATLVRHVGTTARAAEVLVALVLVSRRGEGGDGEAGDGDSSSSSNIKDIVNKSLEALALRNEARNELLKNKDSSRAQLLLSQAIELRPVGGIHIMYKDRSLARLALGNYSGALEDARQSLALHPLYAEAFICQGDAFLAMNQFDSAQKSYSTSLHIDPSIRRSKSFKARIENLEKLTAVDRP